MKKPANQKSPIEKPWSVFKGTRFPKPKHTMISLFCGCGGLDLGFRQAGFDVFWANDIDSNACDTYRKNLGDVVVVGDINKIAWPQSGENLDMLSACFPCQPFSNAGSRRGSKDDRTLNEVALKATKYYQPKVAIYENVRGMLSVRNGNRLVVEQFCKRLNKIGYNAFFKLLDASEHGVAQRRLRVFIVAIRGDYQSDGFVFPAPIEKNGLTLGEIMANIPPGTMNQSEVSKLGPQAEKLCSLIPPGGNWKNVDGRMLPKRLKDLKKRMDRYRAPAFYRRFAKNEIAGTITATFKPEKCGVMHPVKDRPFSVREVARIQSFPDWFSFEGKSVSSKYKQIGNAVPPRLAYEIASNISQVLYGKTSGPSSDFVDIRDFLKKSSPLRVSDPGVFSSAN